MRRSACPDSRVLLCDATYQSRHIRIPEDGGIVGYLLWGDDVSCAVLQYALDLLMAGDVVIGSRAVVASFLDDLRGPCPPALLRPV